MKKHMSKLMAIILCLLMVATTVPFAFAETPTSGPCGDNVYWSYDEDTATLTISGEGSISNVGWSAWETSIETLVVEEGVTSICLREESDAPDMTFTPCINLKNVSIPDSLIRFCFYECSNLTNVTLSAGLTVIPEFAFELCDHLTSITIPGSVTAIGNDAFAFCYALEEITFEAGVTNINAAAFTSCHGIHNITILNPNCEISGRIGTTSVTIYGYSGSTAQDYAQQYYFTFVPLDNPLETTTSGQCGDNVYWSYDEDTATLTISGEGDMWDIFQPWADYRDYIQTAIIEDGVALIADDAFYDCINLINVSIADSVTEIGKSAFIQCRNLNSIEIPNGVIVIPERCFMNCENLTTLTVSNQVSSIGEEAFRGCLKLENFAMPDELTNIGEYAFMNTALTHITVSSKVESIGMAAFASKALASISVDSDNASYFSDENGCLYNKDQTVFMQYPSGYERNSFSIPNSVMSIDGYAFFGSSMEHITIPNGVTSIGEHAFYACESLQGIIVPDGVTSIGDFAFCWCTSLRSATIPYGLTSIGPYVFGYCHSLESIEIPDSVLGIGEDAFCCCNQLTSVTLPVSVKSIGWGAFRACYGPLALTIKNPDCQIWQYEDTISGRVTIYGYPDSTAQAYAETYGRTFVALCPTDHADTINDPGQAATCTEDGYTAGVYCNDCEQWIEGHELIKAGHKDEDGDFICDVCGESTLYTIHVDETLNVAIDGDQKTCIAFRPEETGYYALTSVSDEDTYGCLYDSEMNLLDEDDDSGEGYNFQLVYELTAGETYYYGVRFYGENAAGSFDVTLTKESVYSGPCGDNATWTLIPSNGELHIEGEGTLWEDDAEANIAPWNDYMTQIKTVVMDDGITNIPANAFFGAIHLTRMTLPESLKTVGADAFFLCTRLDYVSLPDGTETIANNAFQGCTSLQAVYIPDSVHTIDIAAFANCPSLLEVVLPEGLTTLEGGLFIGDYRLMNVTIPASVTAINGTGVESPFTYCYSLERIENHSMTTVAAATGFHTLAIPEEIGNDVYLDVLAIGTEMQLLQAAGLFSDADLQVETMTRLEEVLGFDYQTIMEQVAALEPVTPVEGVPETLSFYCFSDSAEHTYCEDNGIPFILLDQGQCGDDVYFTFDRSTGTLSVSGTGAMWDFDIMSGKRAGWRSYADYIHTIVVHDGVTALGWGAFSDCWNNLTNVTLPNTLTDIGGVAFSGCIALTDVTIPDSVTSIGWGAFMNCDGLTQITIPKNVANIESDAFSGCSSLTRFDVDEENAFYSSDDSGCLYNNDKTELIVYPLGNKRTEFTIPTGVTNIKYRAFDYCSQLTSITIPSSVTEIEYMAFSDCTGLQDVYYLGTEAQWNQIEINNNYDENAPLLNATIHFIVTNETGVSLTYEEDVFDEDVEINITEIPTGSENSRAWNITPTLNGEKVQPNGRVQVKLPIPAGWDKSNLVLKHYKEDGSVEYPAFTVEGDYIVFWAEEFSEYALEKAHEHNYDDGVLTKEPTCKEEGVMTFTCDCGDSYTEPVAKLPHTPADAVKENEKAASCEGAGSYDEVVYCEKCSAELSRETKTIAPLGHTSPDEHGNCSRCGKHLIDVCPWCGGQHNGFFQGIIGFFHKIFAKLFGAKY